MSPAQLLVWQLLLSKCFSFLSALSKAGSCPMRTCTLQITLSASLRLRGLENILDGTKPSSAKTLWRASVQGASPAPSPTRPQSCARSPQIPDTGTSFTWFVGMPPRPSPSKATGIHSSGPRWPRPRWQACAPNAWDSASAGPPIFARFLRSWPLHPQVWARSGDEASVRFEIEQITSLAPSQRRVSDEAKASACF